MDSIRIIQLPTKSAASTDDYIAVDSTANGTKKIQFPNFLDNGLTIQNKAADAKATGDAISEVNGAIGNEASTRQSADANLQTQINQIIAPSGEAPSAAEVQNARIGAPPESTVYPTLGDAIRGQVTDLKSNLTFGGYTDIITEWVDGYRIANNSSTLGTPSPNADWRYFKVACQEGDIFNITADGNNTNNYRAWSFVDSSDNIINRSASSSVLNHTVIIAPATSAYLVVNDIKSGGVCYKGISNIDLAKQTFNYNISYAQEISSNSDLDDFKTIGNYIVKTVAVANTIAHIPSAVGGRLNVYCGGQASNIIHEYIGNNGKVYVRAYQPNDDSFSAWIEHGNPQDYIAQDVLAITSSTKYLQNLSNGTDFDDLNTAGNYQVQNNASAKSMTNCPSRYSGKLTVINILGGTGRLQVYQSLGDSAIYFRHYYSSRWHEWKKITTDDTVSGSDTIDETGFRGTYNALLPIMKNSTYDFVFANAPIPIQMLNYMGNNQNVHPKVLYFQNGFGNHKYWMAYTPYPFSNDDYENPCIAYSDDGLRWTNIDGNPLDNPNGVGYNSDTHLVYNDDTSELECWYRFVGDSSQTPREETIYRQTSSDGVTWSTKEVVVSDTSGSITKYLSPAVIYDNGQYLIWCVSGTAFNDGIDFYTAPANDISNWTYVRTFRFSINDDGVTVKPWHIDVIKDGAQYIMLLMCRNGTSVNNNKCSLFVTTSSDNTTYSTPNKVVEGSSNNWDKWMYRSSIVKIGNNYRIYYSAGTGGTTTIYSKSTWGIGICESDSLTHFYGKI